MNVVKEYPDGLFNWVDLSTNDIEGAKAFYTQLFGWEAEDQPISGGGTYTMFKLAGYNVAGGGQMSAEMMESGMPTVWTSYVKHSDADAIAAKITAAGGQVMMPAMDVMEEGRMLMAADPSGAVFGVWQPKNHIGAQLCNIPNTLVWTELQTRDIAGMQTFYAAVFGWTAETDETGYLSFKSDGRMQAGGLAMDDSWGDIPNNWSVYFSVADVPAMCARVEELGGSVMVPPTKIGEMGTFAVVADPQRGVFTMMSFNGEVDLPPGY